MYGPWKLSYAGTTYTFGTSAHAVELVGWESDADSYRVDDAPAPRADGVWFGEDFIEPGEVQISVKIDFTTAPYGPEECARLALEARDTLDRVWRAEALRREPGALAELVMGGEQMIEGRPRRARFDTSFQGRGLIYAELSFIPANTMRYAVDKAGNAPWQSVSLALVAAQAGGLKSPLKEPLRTSVESSRAAPVTITGSTAYPIYELRGPIQSAAQLEVPGRWRLYLNRGLTEFQTARIDTRPGHLGTYLDNRPVQVLDPRSNLLAECTLLPGANVLALRGSSLEGTAKVTARWRESKAGM